MLQVRRRDRVLPHVGDHGVPFSAAAGDERRLHAIGGRAAHQSTQFGGLLVGLEGFEF